MDVSQIRQKKDEAEVKIREILLILEQETNLKIANVSVEIRDPVMMDKVEFYEIGSVAIDLRVP